MKKKSVLFLITLFLLSVHNGNAQQNIDYLKNEGIQQMQKGKYGEAIDLFNKYISAKPRVVDGYLLRGQSYEKRGQLEFAVYDFRSAKKVAPNDQEVDNNLNRATNIWYAQLKKKIEGHKREIAINPAIPINYLEIGKCHKYMGEWVLAEQWYDDYLKREEPSADEVIRYTEILAKNNHIEKGEKILKRFVEKYPNDHRLWSRYGYFTLWLGKRKIAADAFREALKFRPYFKEAQDGLEQAENRPYIYTYYDTTTNYKKIEKEKPPQEYPIDKFYKMLKKNPTDSDTRFLLVDDLVKADRYEEAYEQLQILQTDFTGKDRFTILWDTVTARRDRQFEQKSIEYQAKYEKDPKNKEVVKYIAELYAKQSNYDGALDVLKKYLDGKSETDDPDIRFLLAKYAAWNYQFEASIEQLNYLLAKSPDNLDYQLLRAQVAVWTTTDPELATKYFGNVLAAEPKNVSAILGQSILLIRDRNFPDALTKIEAARQIDPTNKAVENAQNLYDVRLSLEDDIKNHEIYEAAGKLAESGDYPAALAKYEEYFSKIKQPSKIELQEYAYANSSNNNFAKSKEIYEKLLAEDYDYDIAVQHAKVTMWGGDSLASIKEFEKLAKEDTSNYDAKFWMAENYERLKENDKADAIYDNLLATTTDTVKLGYVKQRKSWLQAASVSNSGPGLWNAFSNFPRYTRISPVGAYYADNQNLRILIGSVQFELGLTDYFAVGASFKRLYLRGTFNPYYTSPSSNYIGDYFTKYIGYDRAVDNSMTTLKWHLFFYPTPNIYASFGLGKLSYEGAASRQVYDWTLRYEKKNKVLMMLTYDNTDAVTLLYSTRLVYDPNSAVSNRLGANFYKLQGYYQMSSVLKVLGHFSYTKISDGNASNDVDFKLSRKFSESINGGYEYLMTNFSWEPSFYLYYAPQHFEAHCIWAEWEVPYDEDWTFTVGGRLGYVPSNDFIVRELNGSCMYKISDRFTFSGKAAIGESYRDAASYKYVSAYFSIYYTLF